MMQDDFDFYADSNYEEEEGATNDFITNTANLPTTVAEDATGDDELDFTPPIESKPLSFLVADCGHVNTTVTLYDNADGAYRFIARATAPTTLSHPHANILVGIQAAIREISNVTGRTILSNQGELIRPTGQNSRGVDHFGLAISAINPLKILLVGLTNDVTLASARRAIQRTYSQEIDCFHLDDTRETAAWTTAVIEQEPDLIFIVGGTDGGAQTRLLKLVEAVAVGTAVLADTKKVHLLYAGNTQLREQIANHFHLPVQMAHNVRPTLETEALDEAANIITTYQQEANINTLPGYSQLQKWISYNTQTTAQSFSTTIEYLAALHQGRVVGVDVGSTTTTLVMAEPNQLHTTILNDIGNGQTAANLLQQIPVDDLARWLPDEVDEADIQSFVYNKTLFPTTIPLTEMALQLEQALARELMRYAKMKMFDHHPYEQFTAINLLVARGAALADTPHAGQTILMLLDALQPTGIFAVALDKYGTLPSLGVIAPYSPIAMVQSLEMGALLNLGWVVAPRGRGQPGQKAIDVTVETNKIKLPTSEVSCGSLEILPLTPGEEAQVTLQPTNRFDIGYGLGQGKTLTIQGGVVGLVIDARNRPLEFPDDVVARRSLIRQWLWDMGG